MVEEDMYKTTFRCPDFVGLFKWVVMIFGLKNARAAYPRAMDLIFHELLDIIVEIYLDVIVVKLTRLGSHLVELRLTFEKMHQYDLKMNPLKCTFNASTRNFFGFIIHEHDIEIDPKKVEAIKRVLVKHVKRSCKVYLAR
jgi:hypothetical protein